MKKGYVIAIDGPSGAGKSTVARELAKSLGYRYIDTGAMYRAAALAAHRRTVDIHDPAQLENFLKCLTIRQEMSDGRVLTYLDGEDVSEKIRDTEMSMRASAISALPPVRGRLTELQRKMGAQGAVVMEGRDIGSVVFPDADFKFFLTASDHERARRRLRDLRDAGEDIDEQKVLRDIRQRDKNDSTRAVAPLMRAPGAIEIDSTGKDISQVIEEMKGVVEKGRAE